MRSRSKLIRAIAAIFPSALLLFAYSTGPEPRHTAAPGDDQLACASAGCHNGTALNGGGGSVAKGGNARATATRLGSFLSDVGRLGLSGALNAAGWGLPLISFPKRASGVFLSPAIRRESIYRPLIKLG